VLIIVSEAVAIFLIWKIWLSVDFLMMKIAIRYCAYSHIGSCLDPVDWKFPEQSSVVIAILTLWIGNFPNKAPLSLQNRGTRGHYYLGWRPVFEARNGIRRFRLWREEAGQDPHDDP